MAPMPVITTLLSFPLEFAIESPSFSHILPVAAGFMKNTGDSLKMWHSLPYIPSIDKTSYTL
jgi:hypothetical protein